jgi:hypothetical protein
MVTIKKTTKEYAYSFIYKYHYSKVMPVLTKHYLLVTIWWIDVWIVTLWWGTQPLWTIKKIFPNENLTTASYFEIWKMCFTPECNNGNIWTQIMSELIKFLKKEFPELMFLYTLADGIMWKPWYIYQASNFKYIGSFDTLVYRDNKTWEKIHPRTAKDLCRRNAEFLWKDKVFWLTYDFMDKENISKIQWKMYRYMYPLNRKAKKILDDNYWLLKNPKTADIKWYDMKSKIKIEIPMPEFNMDKEDWFNSKNIQKSLI